MASWQHRIRRLASMQRAELYDRSRQAASLRWDALLAKVGQRRSSGLRTGGADRPGRFFFDTQDVPHLVALLRERLPGQADGIVRRAERILEHRFDLLGFE